MKRKIYDPVHGFIRFNDIERDLIDALPFQRLHYLRQLGIAYFVYPGATHTRFEHSLGVMELSTRIFDRLIEKETFKETDDFAYWRQIIRLAALCHDLGHLPFSHVAEKAILGHDGHEKWTLAVIRSAHLAPVFEQVAKLYPKREVVKDVAKMSLGEKKLKTLDPTLSFTPLEKVFSEVVTADFFGADRIDYLLRDAQCTGVSHGLFDYQQLIEMLCVFAEGKNNLQLGIEENGIESCEALLLARHFMHKRVYQYSSVKAYSFHLARFMKTLHQTLGWFKTLESFLALSDNEVLSALHTAALQTGSPGHTDAACLAARSLRFRAHELPPGVQEAELMALKQRLGIPDGLIAWELASTSKQPLGLSFAVLTASGAVLPASRLSEIVIPLGSVSWVYIAPSFEKQVLDSL